MEEKGRQGYENNREALDDWLDCADALVEFCYEIRQAQKKMEEEQGVAVLSSEQRETLRLRLQQELETRMAVIGLRYSETEDDEEPEIYLLAEGLNLYRNEILGIVLAAACEYGRNYKKLLPEFGCYFWKQICEFLQWDDCYAGFAPDSPFSNCFLRDEFRIQPLLLDYLNGHEEPDEWEFPLVKKDLEKEYGIPVLHEDLERAGAVYEKTQGKNWIFQISGEAGNGKHALMDKVLEERGKTPLFIDMKQMEAATESQRRNWIRAVFLAEKLYQKKAVLELENQTEQTLPLLMQMSSVLESPLLLIKQGDDMEFPVSWPVMRMKLEFPGIRRKVELWQHYLQQYGAENIQPEAQANRYPLNAGGIQSALMLASLLAQVDGRSDLRQEDIAEGVRQIQQHTLGMYATYVHCAFEWDDLIVDAQVTKQMRHICNQMKYRHIVEEKWGFSKKTPYGRAVTALFYGAPGTGKTMAVQVIARELGIDLFRVDLSQMVSKYIGETEKHISELFQKAQNINAILFFDEADALFAKRSEVQDANDRHANAQTAHLLQKIEEYDGIVILATNLKDNIDDAFKRRIKFMVQFTFPTAQTRVKLWESMIGNKAAVEDDLDLEFYGEQFELSGSAIKEVIRNAAYIAASENHKISNQDIKEALKLHYAKSGKILSEEEFRFMNG